MVAKKINYHLDFQKNQLLNAVLQPLSSAPSTPTNGQLYYDTTLGQFGVYQNSAWVYMSAGMSTAAIQGIVAAMLTGNTSPILVTYNSGPQTLTLSIANTSITNAMLASGISADKLTDGATNGVYTLTERSKLAGIAAGATAYTNAIALANRLDQFAAPTASVSMNGQTVTNVGTPVNPTDAINKTYADGLRQGLSIKDPVRVATTAAGTLASSFANGQTVDGVTLATGDRILLKNQASAGENGIYTVNASGAPTRATDADVAAELPEGTAVWVRSGGTTNGNSRWVMTTAGGVVTLGTTAQTWTQDFAATSTTAGAGLTASGNVFAVGAGNGITVNADSIQLDPAVATRKYIGTAIGDGTTTSFAITHSLNTRDIHVMIRDTSTNEIFDVYAVATSTTVATLTFNTAPTTGQYVPIIMG